MVDHFSTILQYVVWQKNIKKYINAAYNLNKAIIFEIRKKISLIASRPAKPANNQKFRISASQKKLKPWFKSIDSPASISVAAFFCFYQSQTSSVHNECAISFGTIIMYVTFYKHRPK